MIPFTKEACKHMFLESKKVLTVQELNLSFGEKTLKVLSAPSNVVEFSDVYSEPMIKELAKNKYNLVCVQHDPMLTMARFRHLGSKVIKDYSHVAQPAESFEFEIPVVHRWEECQATFALQQYLTDKVKSNEEYIKNMHKNIIGKGFIRYPYVNSSLLLAMIHEKEPVLVDIPEQLLRINVANEFSLDKIKEIYRNVISHLKEFYKHIKDDYVSGYEVSHELYPEIFQVKRDLHCISFLQYLAKENDILAVVSAPTFVAIEKFWNEPFTFQTINRCLAKLKEDSEDSLIEKHAILDVIMNTRTWNEKYLKNRFVYINRLENISEETKNTYKSKFFGHYQKYNKEMEKIMEHVVSEANSSE